MGNARAAAIANESREIEVSQQRAIAARQEQDRPKNALQAMATRLQVSTDALRKTLMKTAFSECKNEEQFIALVIVANEYGLNPLLKEIYAFPGKGGQIVPMVSIDGWISLMNRHPEFDGIEFDHVFGEDGKLTAIEAILYRKDRNRPVKVMELFDENKRNTDPWKQMPNRMLRHRALIQAVRIAFGFSGIQDETEAEMIDITPQRATRLPDSRDVGEVLGDEIPDHDRDTGEVVEQEAPARDSRGMTEVDEETARALDQQQEADETVQQIDGEDDAEEEPEPEAEELSPTEQRVKLYRERIAAAKTKQDMTGIDADFLKDRAAFDDAVAEEIDKLIADQMRALPNEGGK